MKKITILLILLNLLIVSCKSNSAELNGFEILNISELKIDRDLNKGMLVLDFGRINGSKNISRIIKIKNTSGQSILFNKQDKLTKEIVFDWGNKPIKPNEIRGLKFTLNSSHIEGEGMSLIQLTTNINTALIFECHYETPIKIVKYSLSQTKLKADKSNNYTFEIKNIGDIAFNITELKSNNQNANINYPKTYIEPNNTQEIIVEFSENIENKNTDITLKIDKITKWPQNIPGIQSEKDIILTIEK